jgi:hypothetical protein
VSVVHDAVQTLTRVSRRKLRGAALVCCAALLSGCGEGSSSKPKARATSSAAAGVGSNIRLDNCTDWQKATVAQRRGTVLELRQFSGGPIGSSAGIQHGPVLSDDRAYKLMQSYCSNHFARGFKLYKLYEHAAAFVGH